MKLRITARIDAPREAVLEYMTSPEYLDDICTNVGEISGGEVEANERDAGTLRHAVRWTAPTKLPSLLKKYEAKAPSHVSWVEETVWDLGSGHASLRVIPDVPDSWHSKYRSSGSIKLQESGSSTELSQDLDFSLDFGLVGKALEKLLKGEVEKLLEARVAVLRRHFSA